VLTVGDSEPCSRTWTRATSFTKRSIGSAHGKRKGAPRGAPFALLSEREAFLGLFPLICYGVT
jgi:hypothetical protein